MTSCGHPALEPVTEESKTCVSFTRHALVGSIVVDRRVPLNDGVWVGFL